MVNTVNMYLKPVCYERVLDLSKLQGRKDCEIMYVTHKGDFQDLCKQAFDRRIVITSISMKEYDCIGKPESVKLCVKKEDVKPDDKSR